MKTVSKIGLIGSIKSKTYDKNIETIINILFDQIFKKEKEDVLSEFSPDYKLHDYEFEILEACGVKLKDIIKVK